MKSFKQYFLEAKQVGILYHYTTIENAFKISRIDTLITSGHWCSFTRDKHFHKYGHDIGGDECRFIIDGDKLSHHYRLKPHNDLTIQPSTRYGKEGYRHDSIVDEQEERIGKDIKGLSSYILKFQINKASLEKWLSDFGEHWLEDRRESYLGTGNITNDNIFKYFNEYWLTEWMR